MKGELVEVRAVVPTWIRDQLRERHRLMTARGSRAQFADVAGQAITDKVSAMIIFPVDRSLEPSTQP